MFTGKAIIGAVLAALVAAAVLAPSAGAVKPCPIVYCTDSNGEYTLEIPPLTNNPFFAEYDDCVWKVEVDFGDGTSEEYVFDASAGLTESHVFPTPGVTYTVVAQLTEGVHADDGEPCPDYGQSGEVRYRTPAEEADDPPPVVPEEKGGTQPPLIPVAPVVQTPNPFEYFERGAEPPAEPPFWRNCRGGVYTHLVGCRWGRRVAKAAGAKLTRPGLAQARGFSCRLPRGPLQSIVCKRGEQSVLAPGPDRGSRRAS